MPWQQASPSDRNQEFVREHRQGLYDMTELAERYGVSRKTGYAPVHRVEEFGMACLQTRNRRPNTSPCRTPDDEATMLNERKLKHPAWGRRCHSTGCGAGTARFATGPRLAPRTRSSGAPAWSSLTESANRGPAHALPDRVPRARVGEG